jgi:type II secretory pathway predicted ATPase ExeA
MPSPSLSLTASQRAFPAHPRADRYFAAASSESARRRILQCLVRGDGPALLLGAPGVGKTMLLEVLSADLAQQGLCVVRLASTQLCTRRALLQAILHGLGAPYRDREEGELRLALTDLLSDPTATGEGVALLVDEAQTLPVRLLEELRVLANVAVEGAPRLRLMLAATHALDEAFTAPELDAFSQRIAARCYLDPLNREETARYVRAHVAVAGGDPDRLLAHDVYETITRASDGLPRLINQVCDRAIVLATEQGRRVIGSAAISEAWSDLHQLAAPWQSPASARIAAASQPKPAVESSIEFGMLDDDSFENGAFDSAARPAQGEWNAGDKLREIATPKSGTPARVTVAVPAQGHVEESFEEDEDDDVPCVAYAFPGALTRFDEEEEALLQEADDLFNEVASATQAKAPKVTASQAKAPKAPLVAKDPFAEEFDEEEVVIDPFAELERVIPAAPVVHSRPSDKSNDLGRALAAIDAAVDGMLADEAFAPQPNAPAKPAIAATDDEILIVEPDEVGSPEARREEYAQLFAKLRHG